MPPLLTCAALCSVQEFRRRGYRAWILGCRQSEEASSTERAAGVARCDVRPDDMLAVESGVSAAHRADLTEQVLEHFDAGKLPLNAIADSNLPEAVAEDQSPA